jgi:hypothetical protein
MEPFVDVVDVASANERSSPAGGQSRSGVLARRRQLVFHRTDARTPSTSTPFRRAQSFVRLSD